MPTGIMIPARHVPSMMGRSGGASNGYGSTSSGLTLAQEEIYASSYTKQHMGVGGMIRESDMFDGGHQQQQQQLHQHQLMQIHHDQQQQQQLAQATTTTNTAESELARVVKEDDFDSKSGSENVEGAASGDDLLQDPNQRPNKKKKRYHRHTQHQIQEMEAFFKECPHPDDKQRKELSRELGLEPLQVKFWFQNKRTQMKTQHERLENQQLRSENEKLRAENMRYKEALSNTSCPNCGGPTAIGEMSYDEQQLKIENVRLRDEIDRISGIAAKYVGKPVISYPHNLTSSVLSRSPLDLGVSNFPTSLTGSDIYGPTTGGGDHLLTRGSGGGIIGPHEAEKPMIVELAVAGMEELTRMAQLGEPLWVNDTGMEKLDEEEYVLTFPRGIGPRPFGLTSESSRDSALVIMNHISLVEILMDVNQWSMVFSSIVSKAATVDVLSTGVAGNYNGALQVISAEYQVPSPLVPTRESYFVRYCKQLQEGIWAVVDVSLDSLLRPNPVLRCRRRPSGCLIQEMPNGYSKVTWVENVEVDDRGVHNIYKQLVNSTIAFGAKRWVSTLDRQCERLASVMASNVPSGDIGVITSQEGRKGMLKLAERMVVSFCSGVTASTAHQWTTLSSGSSDEDVRVMTRKSVNDPGRPPGIVLSAATSFWIPVPPKRVFDFLRDENTRNEWDILSNGGVVQEMAHIANGRDEGNCVSLLRVNGTNTSQSNMLILQESCTDATGSYVIYAPVDVVAMNIVLNGGDPDYVALLPSGFAILPDGPPLPPPPPPATLLAAGDDPITANAGGGGSLLTVAFQILVDSQPNAKLSLGSVATVNNLIACTVKRIKAAVLGENISAQH